MSIIRTVAAEGSENGRKRDEQPRYPHMYAGVCDYELLNRRRRPTDSGRGSTDAWNEWPAYITYVVHVF